MGLHQFTIKLERLTARMGKLFVDSRKRSGQTYVWDRVAEYREMWRGAAKEIGAGFHILDRDVWEIELNGERTRIVNDLLEFDDPVVLEIAGRKPLVYQILKKNGLKVPDFQVFRLDQLERANAFLQKNPIGCVIKPAEGTSSGQGVTTHVQTIKEVRKAAVRASLYCPDLLIEPMIPGECYRLLVLNGKMIHAVRRSGYSLKGDGRSSVADLIRIENDRLAFKKEPLLDVDRDCLFTLGYQDFSLSTVPEADRVFLVKSVNDYQRKYVEVRTVYNETVTDKIGEDLRRNAELSAQLLKSKLVGVDFITTDPAVSLEESRGALNELNTTPGLHHHYDSSVENYPKFAPRLLSALLSRGGPDPDQSRFKGLPGG